MSDITIIAWAWGAAAAVFVLVLWPLSVIRRDASVVDFWWGPGAAVAALTTWALAGAPTGPHALALAALVAGWGLRLGATLGARRLREPEEDPRYAELRRAWDPGFWWKSLFVVFALQGVLQGLVALGAMSGILAAPSDPSALAGLGVAVALGGLLLEASADRQLDRFKAGAPSGALCREGLRRHMRFPHYTGEILFWAGVAAVALDAGVLWAPLPAVLVALLVTKVSGAPMLEEHLARTRPDYTEWKAATPAFLPDPRALGAAARRGLG
jgi:steroid 5-alpha reductase family enzyme